MFKFFLTAAAIGLFVVQASAQRYSISGSVKDARNGQALLGASVNLVPLKQGVIADQQGTFSFSDLVSGTYTIQVSFLGYQTKTEEVVVTDNVSVEILLHESYALTDEVIVYATRANEKTPTTYSNISKEDIQKQNFGQDVPYLLNLMPSVVTTSDAGTGIGYTGIRVRGSDATRVNVTINGIPYNDSESQGSFWVNIADIASSANRIQIQRGVGTSTNGASAFGATMNVETNVKREDPFIENVTSAGSFNTFRNTLSFGSGLLNNHWVVDGRISRIKSDGFIDRAFSDLQSYYFSAGFYSDRTIVKAITFGGDQTTYQAWYGVPESRLKNNVEAMELTAINEGWNQAQLDLLLKSNSRTFNPYTYKNQIDKYKQDHYQLHISQQLGSLVTGNIAFHYTKGVGYFEEFRENEKYSRYGLPPVVIGGETFEKSDFIRRRWLDNDFYGFTYSVNYDGKKLNTVLGGGWNRYIGDHFGRIIWSKNSAIPPDYQYYFNDGDKRDGSVFAKATYDFSSRLTGFVDVQYRHIQYETFGVENKQNTLAIEDEFTFVNPKAGLTYFITPKQSLYFSYSRGNKEPVRKDYTDNFVNVKPKHESMDDFELGFKHVNNVSILNANVYLMNYQNQLVLTGAVNDVGASVRTNVPKSYRMGVEIEGAYKLTKSLSINANVALSQNKILEFTEVYYDYGANWDEYIEVNKVHKNSDISFSPNVVAGGSIQYALTKNLNVAWLSKYVGKQYLDNTSNENRKINVYHTHDVRLTYSIYPSFMREIQLSGLINNVLNAKYESNGYTYGFAAGADVYRENFYFPQAGTNFMVMAALKF
jgi:iron complex outermembrane receptor protein